MVLTPLHLNHFTCKQKLANGALLKIPNDLGKVIALWKHNELDVTTDKNVTGYVQAITCHYVTLEYQLKSRIRMVAMFQRGKHAASYTGRLCLCRYLMQLS